MAGDVLAGIGGGMGIVLDSLGPNIGPASLCQRKMS